MESAITVILSVLGLVASIYPKEIRSVLRHLLGRRRESAHGPPDLQICVTPHHGSSVVFLTHPDDDHLSGLAAYLDRFRAT